MQRKAETKMLNAMENENHGEKEETEDRHPERGQLPGGSDGKGLSQDMATEYKRFTDKEIEEEAEGEEGRKPVAMRAPVQVTRAEREEHELTHTPFRAWCSHCVRGRGKNTPHLKKRGDEDRGRAPRISFDYFFMSWEDEVAHKNHVGYEG